MFDIWGRSGVLDKMLQDRQSLSKTKASDVSAPDDRLWVGLQAWAPQQLEFPLAAQVLTCPSTSFTDLAEIVSRIEPAQVATVDGEY